LKSKQAGGFLSLAAQILRGEQHHDFFADDLFAPADFIVPQFQVVIRDGLQVIHVI
jgi:hypothetical protein